MDSTPDLFVAAGLSLADDFTPRFLADLHTYGNTTASETRQRHHIAGVKAIGAAVRHLSRRGFIYALGIECSRDPNSHRHLERRWTLTEKGRAEVTARQQANAGEVLP